VINESSSTFEVLRPTVARASISEEEMAALNERIVSSISASAHDRYLRFLVTIRCWRRGLRNGCWRRTLRTQRRGQRARGYDQGKRLHDGFLSS
jgi:hypothetical protein